MFKKKEFKKYANFVPLSPSLHQIYRSSQIQRSAFFIALLISNSTNALGNF